MATPQHATGELLDQPVSATRSFKDVLGKRAETPSFLPAVDFQVHEGRHKGAPSLTFSKLHIAQLSQPFQWTLVGKFSYGYNKQNPKMGRPPVAALTKYFEAFDFKGDFKLGLLDNRHLLIHFKVMDDFLRMYSRPVWYIHGHPMRVFKWSPSFHVDRESSLVPVWVGLPRLPVHFFETNALLSICKLIGCPLRIDNATLNLKRPSMARVQIEIDLLKERPQKIWIEVEGSEGFWQKLDYENVPPYCQHCWHVGHEEASCHVHHPELRQSLIKENSKPVKRQEYVQVTRPAPPMPPATQTAQNALEEYIPKAQLHNTNNNNENPTPETAVHEPLRDKGKALIVPESATMGEEQATTSNSAGETIMANEMAENEKSFSAGETPEDLVENDNSGSAILTNESGKEKEVALDSRVNKIDSFESSKVCKAPADLVNNDTAPPLSIVPIMSESLEPPYDGSSTNTDDESELEEDSDTVVYEEVIVMDKTGRLRLQLQPVQPDFNTPGMVSAANAPRKLNSTTPPPESPAVFPKSSSDVSPVPSAPSPTASPGEDGTLEIVSLSAPAIMDSTVDATHTSTQDARLQDDFQQPKYRGRKKKHSLGHEITSRSSQVTRPTVASFTLLPEE